MTRVAKAAEVLILILSTTGALAGAPEFILLPTPSSPFGYAESAATGVSADGSVVVGKSSSANHGNGCLEAFRWAAVAGMEFLGAAPCGSEAYGVSPDGSVVVGIRYSFDIEEAFRWTAADGIQGLGFLPGDTKSWATGVAVNGSAIAGWSCCAAGLPGVRWTTNGVQQGPNLGSASAISADGSTIVGSRIGGLFHAYRWMADDSVQDLGVLPTTYAYPESQAHAVSADGAVVVGYSRKDGPASNLIDYYEWNEAFRWTAADGMVGLGVIGQLQYDVAPQTYAYGVSGDGLIVVGYANSFDRAGAFIWDATNGMRYLQDVLENDFGLDLGGVTLDKAWAISADGKTIVGEASNPNIGGLQAFVARLGNTAPGSGIPADLGGGTQSAGGATLTFSQVTTGGESTMMTSSTGPTPPGGFQLGAPATYYDVNTTATFIGTIEVCINYSTASFGDETALRLFHFENDVWTDVTTSLDTGGDIICGQVTSLSPFVVVEPGDSDGDGLLDSVEVTIGTDPLNPDTDADGLLDGTEVDMAMGGGCPDPVDGDSDNDGIADGAEVSATTNACNVDTDADGVPDGVDPLPTEPGVTTGYLENSTRDLATDRIPALGLDLFNGPNDNADNGRRNALANRAADAANAIADGAYQSAIDSLNALLEKIDSVEPAPDWLHDSPQKTDLADDVRLLIDLVEMHL